MSFAFSYIKSHLNFNYFSAIRECEIYFKLKRVKQHAQLINIVWMENVLKVRKEACPEESA